MKRVSTYLAAACVLVLAGSGGAVAAEGRAEELADQADKAYQAEDWSAAATAYGAITESRPDNGRAWYRLAVSLRRMGKLEEASAALEAAAGAGVPTSYTAYQQSLLDLAAGDTDKAMQSLRGAVAAGYRNEKQLKTDPALEPLRAHAGFQGVLDAVGRSARPCEFDPRYRQFDFWAGEWEVFMADGSRAGHNTITVAEQGCLLLEQWRGAGGGTGTSMNYFDPAREQWVQVWMGSGFLIDIRGGLADGSMILTGDIFYLADATTKSFRGTWTPLEDGRVRQFFEESGDGGETWAPWFEGFYVRGEARPGK